MKKSKRERFLFGVAQGKNNLKEIFAGSSAFMKNNKVTDDKSLEAAFDGMLLQLNARREGKGPEFVKGDLFSLFVGHWIKNGAKSNIDTAIADLKKDGAGYFAIADNTGKTRKEAIIVAISQNDDQRTALLKGANRFVSNAGYRRAHGDVFRKTLGAVKDELNELLSGTGTQFTDRDVFTVLVGYFMATNGKADIRKHIKLLKTDGDAFFTIAKVFGVSRKDAVVLAMLQNRSNLENLLDGSAVTVMSGISFQNISDRLNTLLGRKGPEFTSKDIFGILVNHFIRKGSTSDIENNIKYLEATLASSGYFKISDYLAISRKAVVAGLASGSILEIASIIMASREVNASTTSIQSLIENYRNALKAVTGSDEISNSKLFSVIRGNLAYDGADTDILGNIVTIRNVDPVVLDLLLKIGENGGDKDAEATILRLVAGGKAQLERTIDGIKALMKKYVAEVNESIANQMFAAGSDITESEWVINIVMAGLERDYKEFESLFPGATKAGYYAAVGQHLGNAGSAADVTRNIRKLKKHKEEGGALFRIGRELNKSDGELALFALSQTETGLNDLLAGANEFIRDFTTLKDANMRAGSLYTLKKYMSDTLRDLNKLRMDRGGSGPAIRLSALFNILIRRFIAEGAKVDIRASIGKLRSPKADAYFEMEAALGKSRTESILFAMSQNSTDLDNLLDGYNAIKRKVSKDPDAPGGWKGLAKAVRDLLNSFLSEAEKKDILLSFSKDDVARALRGHAIKNGKKSSITKFVETIRRDGKNYFEIAKRAGITKKEAIILAVTQTRENLTKILDGSDDYIRKNIGIDEVATAASAALNKILGAGSNIKFTRKDVFSMLVRNFIASGGKFNMDFNIMAMTTNEGLKDTRKYIITMRRFGRSAKESFMGAASMSVANLGKLHRAYAAYKDTDVDNFGKEINAKDLGNGAFSTSEIGSLLEAHALASGSSVDLKKHINFLRSEGFKAFRDVYTAKGTKTLKDAITFAFSQSRGRLNNLGISARRFINDSKRRGFSVEQGLDDVRDTLNGIDKNNTMDLNDEDIMNMWLAGSLEDEKFDIRVNIAEIGTDAGREALSMAAALEDVTREEVVMALIPMKISALKDVILKLKDVKGAKEIETERAKANGVIKAQAENVNKNREAAGQAKVSAREMTTREFFFSMVRSFASGSDWSVFKSNITMLGTHANAANFFASAANAGLDIREAFIVAVVMGKGKAKDMLDKFEVVLSEDNIDEFKKIVDEAIEGFAEEVNAERAKSGQGPVDAGTVTAQQTFMMLLRYLAAEPKATIAGFGKHITIDHANTVNFLASAVNIGMDFVEAFTMAGTMGSEQRKIVLGEFNKILTEKNLDEFRTKIINAMKEFVDEEVGAIKAKAKETVKKYRALAKKYRKWAMSAVEGRVASFDELADFYEAEADKLDSFITNTKFDSIKGDLTLEETFSLLVRHLSSGGKIDDFAEKSIKVMLDKAENTAFFLVSAKNSGMDMTDAFLMLMVTDTDQLSGLLQRFNRILTTDEMTEFMEEILSGAKEKLKEVNEARVKEGKSEISMDEFTLTLKDTFLLLVRFVSAGGKIEEFGSVNSVFADSKNSGKATNYIMDAMALGGMSFAEAYTFAITLASVLKVQNLLAAFAERADKDSIEGFRNKLNDALIGDPAEKKARAEKKTDDVKKMMKDPERSKKQGSARMRNIAKNTKEKETDAVMAVYSTRAEDAYYDDGYNADATKAYDKKAVAWQKYAEDRARRNELRARLSDDDFAFADGQRAANEAEYGRLDRRINALDKKIIVIRENALRTAIKIVNKENEVSGDDTRYEYRGGVSGDEISAEGWLENELAGFSVRVSAFGAVTYGKIFTEDARSEARAIGKHVRALKQEIVESRKEIAWRREAIARYSQDGNDKGRILLESQIAKYEEQINQDLVEINEITSAVIGLTMDALYLEDISVSEEEVALKFDLMFIAIDGDRAEGRQLAASYSDGLSEVSGRSLMLEIGKLREDVREIKQQIGMSFTDNEKEALKEELENVDQKIAELKEERKEAIRALFGTVIGQIFARVSDLSTEDRAESADKVLSAVMSGNETEVYTSLDIRSAENVVEIDGYSSGMGILTEAYGETRFANKVKAKMDSIDALKSGASPFGDVTAFTTEETFKLMLQHFANGGNMKSFSANIDSIMNNRDQGAVNFWILVTESGVDGKEALMFAVTMDRKSQVAMLSQFAKQTLTKGDIDGIRDQLINIIKVVSPETKVDIETEAMFYIVARYFSNGISWAAVLRQVEHFQDSVTTAEKRVYVQVVVKMLVEEGGMSVKDAVLWSMFQKSGDLVKFAVVGVGFVRGLMDKGSHAGVTVDVTQAITLLAGRSIEDKSLIMSLKPSDVKEAVGNIHAELGTDVNTIDKTEVFLGLIRQSFGGKMTLTNITVVVEAFGPLMQGEEAKSVKYNMRSVTLDKNGKMFAGIEKANESMKFATMEEAKKSLSATAFALGIAAKNLSMERYVIDGATYAGATIGENGEVAGVLIIDKKTMERYIELRSEEAKKKREGVEFSSNALVTVIDDLRAMLSVDSEIDVSALTPTVEFVKHEEGGEVIVSARVKAAPLFVSGSVFDAINLTEEQKIQISEFLSFVKKESAVDYTLVVDGDGNLSVKAETTISNIDQDKARQGDGQLRTGLILVVEYLDDKKEHLGISFDEFTIGVGGGSDVVTANGEANGVRYSITSSDKNGAFSDISEFDSLTGELKDTYIVRVYSAKKSKNLKAQDKKVYYRPDEESQSQKDLRSLDGGSKYAIRSANQTQWVVYDSETHQPEQIGSYDKGEFVKEGDYSTGADGELKLTHTGTFGWWKNIGGWLSEKIEYGDNGFVNLFHGLGVGFLRVLYTAVDALAKIVVDIIGASLGAIGEAIWHFGLAIKSTWDGQGWSGVWRNVVATFVGLLWSIDVEDGEFTSSGRDTGVIKGILAALKDLAGGIIKIGTDIADTARNSNDSSDYVSDAFKTVLVFFLNMMEKTDPVRTEGSYAYNNAILQDYQILVDKAADRIRSGDASADEKIAYNMLYLMQAVDITGISSGLNMDDSVCATGVVVAANVINIIIQVAMIIIAIPSGGISAVIEAIGSVLENIWQFIKSVGVFIKNKLFSKSTATTAAKETGKFSVRGLSKNIGHFFRKTKEIIRDATKNAWKNKGQLGVSIGKIFSVGFAWNAISMVANILLKFVGKLFSKQGLLAGVRGARVGAAVYMAVDLVMDMYEAWYKSDEISFGQAFDRSAAIKAALSGAWEGFIFAAVLGAVANTAKASRRLEIFARRGGLGVKKFSIAEKALWKKLFARASSLDKAAFRIGEAFGSFAAIPTALRVFAITGTAVTVNMMKDLVDGNLNSWADIRTSFLTGILYGLFASYVLSGTGAKHLRSISKNVSKLSDAAAIETAMLKGAAEWIMVSPFFTFFGAMWEAFADGIGGMIFGGNMEGWHGLRVATGKDKDGNLTYQNLDLGVLIKSALEGPKAGMKVGVLVGLFGAPIVSTSPYSLDAVLTQTQGPIGKLKAVFARMFSGSQAAWKKWVVSTTASRQITMSVGTVFNTAMAKVFGWMNVAGTVTLINTVLKQLEQKTEGGAGLSELENEFFSWALLFLKPTFVPKQSKAFSAAVQEQFRIQLTAVSANVTKAVLKKCGLTLEDFKSGKDKEGKEIAPQISGEKADTIKKEVFDAVLVALNVKPGTQMNVMAMVSFEIYWMVEVMGAKDVVDGTLNSAVNKIKIQNNDQEQQTTEDRKTREQNETEGSTAEPTQIETMVEELGAELGNILSEMLRGKGMSGQYKKALDGFTEYPKAYIGKNGGALTADIIAALIIEAAYVAYKASGNKKVLSKDQIKTIAIGISKGWANSQGHGSMLDYDGLKGIFDTFECSGGKTDVIWGTIFALVLAGQKSGTLGSMKLLFLTSQRDLVSKDSKGNEYIQEIAKITDGEFQIIWVKAGGKAFRLNGSGKEEEVKDFKTLEETMKSGVILTDAGTFLYLAISKSGLVKGISSMLVDEAEAVLQAVSLVLSEGIEYVKLVDPEIVKEFEQLVGYAAKATRHFESVLRREDSEDEKNKANVDVNEKTRNKSMKDEGARKSVLEGLYREFTQEIQEGTITKKTLEGMLDAYLTVYKAKNEAGGFIIKNNTYYLINQAGKGLVGTHFSNALLSLMIGVYDKENMINTKDLFNIFMTSSMRESIGINEAIDFVNANSKASKMSGSGVDIMMGYSGTREGAEKTIKARGMYLLVVSESALTMSGVTTSGTECTTTFAIDVSGENSMGAILKAKAGGRLRAKGSMVCFAATTKENADEILKALGAEKADDGTWSVKIESKTRKVVVHDGVESINQMSKADKVKAGEIHIVYGLAEGANFGGVLQGKLNDALCKVNGDKDKLSKDLVQSVHLIITAENTSSALAQLQYRIGVRINGEYRRIAGTVDFVMDITRDSSRLSNAEKAKISELVREGRPEALEEAIVIFKGAMETWNNNIDMRQAVEAKASQTKYNLDFKLGITTARRAVIAGLAQSIALAGWNAKSDFEKISQISTFMTDQNLDDQALTLGEFNSAITLADFKFLIGTYNLLGTEQQKATTIGALREALNSGQDGFFDFIAGNGTDGAKAFVADFGSAKLTIDNAYGFLNLMGIGDGTMEGIASGMARSIDVVDNVSGGLDVNNNVVRHMTEGKMSDLAAFRTIAGMFGISQDLVSAQTNQMMEAATIISLGVYLSKKVSLQQAAFGGGATRTEQYTADVDARADTITLRSVSITDVSGNEYWFGVDSALVDALGENTIKEMLKAVSVSRGIGLEQLKNTIFMADTESSTIMAGHIMGTGKNDGIVTVNLDLINDLAMEIVNTSDLTGEAKGDALRKVTSAIVTVGLAHEMRHETKGTDHVGGTASEEFMLAVEDVGMFLNLMKDAGIDMNDGANLKAVTTVFAKRNMGAFSKVFEALTEDESVSDALISGSVKVSLQNGVLTFVAEVGVSGEVVTKAVKAVAALAKSEKTDISINTESITSEGVKIVSTYDTSGKMQSAALAYKGISVKMNVDSLDSMDALIAFGQETRNAIDAAGSRTEKLAAVMQLAKDKTDMKITAVVGTTNEGVRVESTFDQGNLREARFTYEGITMKSSILDGKTETVMDFAETMQTKMDKAEDLQGKLIAALDIEKTEHTKQQATVSVSTVSVATDSGMVIESKLNVSGKMADTKFTYKGVVVQGEVQVGMQNSVMGFADTLRNAIDQAQTETGQLAGVMKTVADTAVIKASNVAVQTDKGVTISSKLDARGKMTDTKFTYKGVEVKGDVVDGKMETVTSFAKAMRKVVDDAGDDGINVSGVVNVLKDMGVALKAVRTESAGVKIETKLNANGMVTNMSVTVGQSGFDLKVDKGMTTENADVLSGKVADIAGEMDKSAKAVTKAMAEAVQKATEVLENTGAKISSLRKEVSGVKVGAKVDAKGNVTDVSIAGRNFELKTSGVLTKDGIQAVDKAIETIETGRTDTIENFSDVMGKAVSEMTDKGVKVDDLRMEASGVKVNSKLADGKVLKTTVASSKTSLDVDMVQGLDIADTGGVNKAIGDVLKQADGADKSVKAMADIVDNVTKILKAVDGVDAKLSAVRKEVSGVTVEAGIENNKMTDMTISGREFGLKTSGVLTDDGIKAVDNFVSEMADAAARGKMDTIEDISDVMSEAMPEMIKNDVKVEDLRMEAKGVKVVSKLTAGKVQKTTVTSGNTSLDMDMTKDMSIEATGGMNQDIGDVLKAVDTSGKPVQSIMNAASNVGEILESNDVKMTALRSETGGVKVETSLMSDGRTIGNTNISGTGFDLNAKISSGMYSEGIEAIDNTITRMADAAAGDDVNTLESLGNITGQAVSEMTNAGARVDGVNIRAEGIEVNSKLDTRGNVKNSTVTSGKTSLDVNMGDAGMKIEATGDMNRKIGDIVKTADRSDNPVQGALDAANGASDVLAGTDANLSSVRKETNGMATGLNYDKGSNLRNVSITQTGTGFGVDIVTADGQMDTDAVEAISQVVSQMTEIDSVDDFQKAVDSVMETAKDVGIKLSSVRANVSGNVAMTSTLDDNNKMMQQAEITVNDVTVKITALEGSQISADAIEAVRNVMDTEITDAGSFSDMLIKTEAAAKAHGAKVSSIRAEVRGMKVEVSEDTNGNLSRMTVKGERLDINVKISGVLRETLTSVLTKIKTADTRMDTANTAGEVVVLMDGLVWDINGTGAEVNNVNASTDSMKITAAKDMSSLRLETKPSVINIKTPGGGAKAVQDFVSEVEVAAASAEKVYAANGNAKEYYETVTSAVTEAVGEDNVMVRVSDLRMNVGSVNVMTKFVDNAINSIEIRSGSGSVNVSGKVDNISYAAGFVGEVNNTIEAFDAVSEETKNEKPVRSSAKVISEACKAAGAAGIQDVRASVKAADVTVMNTDNTGLKADISVRGNKVKGVDIATSDKVDTAEEIAKSVRASDDNVSRSQNGILNEGETVTVVFDGVTYEVTGQDGGVNLAQAVLSRMSGETKEAFKAMLEAQFGSENLLPYESKTVVLSNGDMIKQIASGIKINKDGTIEYMNSTVLYSKENLEKIRKGEVGIVHSEHSHPELTKKNEQGKLSSDAIAIMVEKVILGGFVDEVISERAEDGSIKKRLFTLEGNDFVLYELDENGDAGEVVLKFSVNEISQDAADLLETALAASADDTVSAAVASLRAVMNAVSGKMDVADGAVSVDETRDGSVEVTTRHTGAKQKAQDAAVVEKQAASAADLAHTDEVNLKLRELISGVMENKSMSPVALQDFLMTLLAPAIVEGNQKSIDRVKRTLEQLLESDDLKGITESAEQDSGAKVDDMRAGISGIKVIVLGVRELLRRAAVAGAALQMLRQGMMLSNDREIYFVDQAAYEQDKEGLDRIIKVFRAINDANNKTLFRVVILGDKNDDTDKTKTYVNKADGIAVKVNNVIDETAREKGAGGKVKVTGIAAADTEAAMTLRGILRSGKSAGQYDYDLILAGAEGEGGFTFAKALAVAITETSRFDAAFTKRGKEMLVEDIEEDRQTLSIEDVSAAKEGDGTTTATGASEAESDIDDAIENLLTSNFSF